MTANNSPHKKHLRIAVLVRIFSISAGGAERYCASLVKQLAPQHEIHVFAQDIRTEYPQVVFHPVPLFCRRPRWLNQIAFACYTWWKTRNGFDVVHSHENTWHGDVQTIHVLPFSYLWFFNRHGWSLFFKYLQLVTSPRLLTYWVLEKLRMRHQPGRFLVAVSEPVKKVLNIALHHKIEHIRVISPGIEATHVHSSTEKMQARLDLGLPMQGKCLLWVGNNATKKGLPTLIEALAQLPKEIFLVIVGSAAPESKWRSQVAELELEDRIYFKGVLDDMTLAYTAADLLVHPTLEDTFGMVVLEAMAHAVPVTVSSAHYCGISAELSHLKNAWILQDPLDTNALKDAIDKSLESNTHEAMSQQAISWAGTQDWHHLALAQETLYYDVVKLKT
jgi:UDP-glucose:(heptosyl)LPS alpha-1,3-glucosyltransferase